MNFINEKHRLYKKLKGRPLLDDFITKIEFQKHYWLKWELISFCKNKNLNSAGSKEKLQMRVKNILD